MDGNQRPLRLLSLDGGGIRGLSSLYILRGIMARVRSKHPQNKLLLPCEYFDLIAGTSTGGIIAIMLGVLKMDVEECIEEYLNMAPMIFPREGFIASQSFYHVLTAAWGQNRFDPIPLEKAIKNLVKERFQSSKGENAALRSDSSQMQQQQCKVFVCATSKVLTKDFRLRNYESPWDITDDCTIWQACRATSAAPFIFPPIKFGKPAIEYLDGALQFNNHIRALDNEVRPIWPQRNVGCMVSIGTGVELRMDFGNNLKDLLKTLKDIATSTQQVAREFKRKFEAEHSERNIYFRFNVDQGLGGIGLEEWREFDRVSIATQGYLQDNEEVVDLCASQIYKPIDCVPLKFDKFEPTPAKTTVPYARDSKFVKRGDIIAKIDRILSTSNWHKRAALTGLDGMGKSQIAIEYSHLLQEKDPYTWVFWVHASNRIRFEQAYREIAVAVDLKGLEDPKAPILVLVSDWLKDARNGSWLMVLDNADDSTMFFQPSSPNLGNGGTNSTRLLMDFIPQKAHGKILVTSRDQSVAQDLVGNYGAVVDVTAMSPMESLELFKSKVSDDTVIDGAAPELLDALEHIPLAVSQAGAFIRQQRKMVTISGYLSAFRRSQTDQAALLDTNMRDLRRDPTVPNAVISTWKISFNQIRDQNQPAADFLSLMALFDRNSIPKLLLQESDEDLAFWSAISPLLDFSLVSVGSDRKSFSMHRLVQIATLKWLDNNQSLQNWESRAIQRIAERFPDGDFEDWEICGLLLPHAEKIITYNAKGEESRLEYASILGKTGNYLSGKGNDDLAEQRLERSLNIRRKYLDDEDPRVFSSMANLALTFANQGRWKEAEDLQREAMQTSSRVLGEDHPCTLRSLIYLVTIYQNQGQWEMAEKVGIQVMETNKRVLGKEHPNTLGSMTELAWTLAHQGRWKEAEELEIQNMKTSERVPGKKNLGTLESMELLTSIHLHRGRLKEAEDLGMQVVEIRGRILGKEHPHTLASMDHLALVFCEQQRWEEAEGLEMQIIEIKSRKFGKEHPNTLTSMGNLAQIFASQQRWEEAEVLETQVLESKKRVLGKEHPDTLTSMSNLAHNLHALKHTNKAIRLMTHVVKWRTEKIGPDHPYTLRSKDTLREWKKERRQR